MNELDEQIPPASEAVEAITEPLADAADAVQDATTTAITNMSEALRLHGESLRNQQGVLDSLQGNTATIINRLNELGTSLATAAVDIPAEVVETATDLPVEGTEKIETVVEDVTEPPNSGKRGRLRRRKRTRE